MPVLEPTGAYRPPAARSFAQPTSAAGTEEARSSSSRRPPSGSFYRADAPPHVFAGNSASSSCGGSTRPYTGGLRQASADRSQGGGGRLDQQTSYYGGGRGRPSSRERAAGGEMTNGRYLFSGGGGDANSRPAIIAHPPSSPNSSNRRENMQRVTASGSPLLSTAQNFHNTAPLIYHSPPTTFSAPSAGGQSAPSAGGQSAGGQSAGGQSGTDFNSRQQYYHNHNPTYPFSSSGSSFSQQQRSSFSASSPPAGPSSSPVLSQTRRLGGGGLTDSEDPKNASDDGGGRDDKKAPTESDGWGDDDDGFGGGVSMLDISQIQEKAKASSNSLATISAGARAATAIVGEGGGGGIGEEEEANSTANGRVEGIKESGGGGVGCDKSTLSMCSDLSTSSTSDASTNPSSAVFSPPPVADCPPSPPPPAGSTTDTVPSVVTTAASSPASPAAPAEQQQQQPWRLGRLGNPRALLQRKVQCLLNKLTVENFARITEQLGELTDELKEEALVRLLVDLVLEKACLEPDWSEMYADVCQVLKWRSSIQQGRGQDTAGGGGGRAVPGGRAWFGTGLVEKIREELSRLPTSLTLASDQVLDLSAEEVAIKAKKLKNRTMGVVKLIGELFYRKMLSGKTLNLLATHLVFSAEYPEEHFVELFCNLASTVGYYMDETGGSSKLQLDTWMGRLTELQKSKKYTKRACCVIQDLGDCRKAKWYKKTHKESAKALNDLHDQLGREEDCGGSVIAAQFGNVVVMGSRANIQAKGSYGQYMEEQQKRYQAQMMASAK
eukprot:GHVS01022198.1.p1 GENE.GHVS01022198.1~~GHVS01022198.1.p1  ORF type:complete len:778 (-),score=215.11 GHVS01022198.1:498-2831(-)